MVRQLKIAFLFALLAALAAAPAWSAGAVTIESKYPGLSSGALGQATPGYVKGALLEVDGQTITSKQLTDRLAQVQSPGKEQYRKYQFALLEDMAISLLLDKEARKWALDSSRFGLEGEKLMQEYVTHLVGDVTVTEDEARQFYKDFPGMVGKATFEQAKSAIMSFIKQDKVEALLNKHIATMSARHTVRVSDTWARQQYRTWTRTPIEAARRSGKPTLAKFGAERCMPCRALAPIIKELQKKHEAALNVVDINSDKEFVVSNQYGVVSIPLMVFYDKDGKEKARLTGYHDKAAIEAKLAEIGVK